MHLSEKILILKGIEPFASVSDNELAVIAEKTDPVTFSAGKTIIAPYDMATKAFILVSGETDPFAPEGSILAYESLLFGTEVKTGITAKTNVQCLEVSRGHFFTMIYELSEIPLFLMKQSPDQWEANR